MNKILLTTAAAVVFAASSTQALANNFFAKVNLGRSNLSQVRDATINKNTFVGFGVGYHLMHNVRADVTFDYFDSPTLKQDGKKIKGEISTLLLNGFIEVFDISITQIFIGAGIGGGRVQAEITGDNLAANNGIAKKKYNIARAFYLGSAIEFLPKVSAEIVYSYRSMGKTTPVNNADFDFTGHNVAVGVRFDL